MHMGTYSVILFGYYGELTAFRDKVYLNHSSVLHSARDDD